MGLGGGGTFSRLSDCGGGSGLGVSSMVECLPIVHGGIERNSSKVRTRDLQHFQPVAWSQPEVEEKTVYGRPDTFLAFMELGRS